MVYQRKTRSEPSREAPLTEPTMNRRIWGAYLEAGWNRNTWADALGMSYQGIDLIDSGKSMPQLPTLMRMQELIGKYTLDELVYGHNPPTMKRFEPELTHDAVKAVLWQLACAPDTLEALGDFTESASGKYVRLTRSYVVAWSERYQLARKEGMPRQSAIDVAKQIASAAQAHADAIAAQVKPVTPAQLAAA